MKDLVKRIEELEKSINKILDKIDKIERGSKWPWDVPEPNPEPHPGWPKPNDWEPANPWTPWPNPTDPFWSKSFKCPKCGMEFESGKAYAYHCPHAYCPMNLGSPYYANVSK